MKNLCILLNFQIQACSNSVHRHRLSMMSFVTQFRTLHPRVFICRRCRSRRRLVLVGNFFLDWIFLLTCGILHTYLINIAAVPSSEDEPKITEMEATYKENNSWFCILYVGDYSTLNGIACTLYANVYSKRRNLECSRSFKDCCNLIKQ